MNGRRDAYDTVRNLRPLPGPGSAMNHPEDHGSQRAEACMKLLLERFPHVQALALKRCEKQDSFRELCEEYWACTEVLARLERPGSEEDLRTEYGALRLRLEGELLRYLAEQTSRAGSQKP